MTNSWQLWNAPFSPKNRVFLKKTLQVQSWTLCKCASWSWKVPPSPRTRTKRMLPTPGPAGFAADKEIEDDGSGFFFFFFTTLLVISNTPIPPFVGGWFPRYWSVPNFPVFLHCFHSPHLFCNLLFSRIRRLRRFLQVSILRWSRFYFPIPFEGCGNQPTPQKIFFFFLPLSS